MRKQVVKPVKERLEAFKSKINKLYGIKDTRDASEVEESKLTLKKFAIKYRIKGKGSYDPKRSLSAVKETVETS